MARSATMRGAVGRDPQFTRMVGVSALLHVALIAAVLVGLPLVGSRPLPIVAYTVELTDPNSLGGRLAPGATDLPMGARAGESAPKNPPRQGEPTGAPEPAPAPPAPPKPVETAKAPEPPKPVEPPKPAEPVAKLPSIEKPPPKPEAKKPEPKPEPKPEAKKPEPKPEPKPKVEAKPAETAKKPDPKAEAKAAEPAKKPDPKAAATAKADPAAKPSAKPESKPETKPAGRPDGAPDGDAAGADAYASAAAKWRARAATGGGGGLGGTDTRPGPMGTPGYGEGGGGQVVGFEFLAYQQRVVSTVKSVWTNVAPRPGLVAKVRFRIAPDGEVSGVRIEQASGNGVFDSSALRAVERASPLPPPPARYVNEFRDFMIEFHSEEGGRASG